MSQQVVDAHRALAFEVRIAKAHIVVALDAQQRVLDLGDEVRLDHIFEDHIAVAFEIRVFRVQVDLSLRHFSPFGSDAGLPGFSSAARLPPGRPRPSLTLRGPDFQFTYLKYA